MSPSRPEYRSHRLFAILGVFLLLSVALTAQQTSLLPVAEIPSPPLLLEAALPRNPLTAGPTLIVVGFAGGFIKRTSAIHGEIGLALRLREKYSAGIQSEIFEHHHGDAAHREILRLIDASTATRQSARVILYGHSWGASETVAVARQLQQDGVPVLLLVQVDGVQKRQHDDSVIPANVRQAINFYQTEGSSHAISAADPSVTRILGNVHLTYKDNDVPTPGYPWFARVFTKRHIEIENDPRVWDRVEAMILADLPAPAL